MHKHCQNRRSRLILSYNCQYCYSSTQMRSQTETQIRIKLKLRWDCRLNADKIETQVRLNSDEITQTKNIWLELVSKQLTHSSDIQRFEIKVPRVRETKLFLNGSPGIQEPPDTLECGLSLKPETLLRLSKPSWRR